MKVPHRHEQATKEGVGTLAFCLTLFRKRVTHVGFRPDLPGAGWHEIPPSLVEPLVACTTPLEAMAVVRRG